MSHMYSILRTIQVNWQHRVFFSDNVFDPANLLLRDVLGEGGGNSPCRALVVVDAALASAQPELQAGIENYFQIHNDRVGLACPPIVGTGGENAKASWSTVSEIHAAIDHYHIDRHSYLIAVGGGALLDMVGLAAATAHRGVRHIRIPTTTLSQCDSGVGVKNGINAFGKKNFIGTFAPPYAVFNDFQFLATLPPGEMRAGYVEAVKVACIRSRDFFEYLEREVASLARFEAGAMRTVIRRCAQLHVDHIVNGGDPFEFGSARPLDFGHWAAHKLEQLSDFSLSHGAAVAIGIAVDVAYSRRAGFLRAEAAERVLLLLEGLGFSLFCPELVREKPGGGLAVLDGIEEFREHLGGKLAITLLRDVGEGFEAAEMNARMVHESITELRTRCRA